MKEPLPVEDFYTFISRKERHPLCDVCTWSIRRKLPRLPIPLNKPDMDIVLDLMDAFNTTYECGGYDRDISYDVPLPQTLSSGDREWTAATINNPVK